MGFFGELELGGLGLFFFFLFFSFLFFFFRPPRSGVHVDLSLLLVLVLVLGSGLLGFFSPPLLGCAISFTQVIGSLCCLPRFSRLAPLFLSCVLHLLLLHLPSHPSLPHWERPYFGKCYEVNT